MSEKSERLDLVRWKIERMLEIRPQWTLDQHAEYLALVDEEVALLERDNAET